MISFFYIRHTPQPAAAAASTDSSSTRRLQRSCASPALGLKLSQPRRGEESDAVDDRSGGVDELLPAISTARITAAVVNSYEPQSDLESVRGRESRCSRLAEHARHTIAFPVWAPSPLARGQPWTKTACTSCARRRVPPINRAIVTLVRLSPPFGRCLTMTASTAVDYKQGALLYRQYWDGLLVPPLGIYDESRIFLA